MLRKRRHPNIVSSIGRTRYDEVNRFFYNDISFCWICANGKVKFHV